MSSALKRALKPLFPSPALIEHFPQPGDDNLGWESGGTMNFMDMHRRARLRNGFRHPFHKGRLLRTGPSCRSQDSARWRLALELIQKE